MDPLNNDTANNTLKQEDYAYGLTMMTWETEKRKLWEQMNKNTQRLRSIKDAYGQSWPCKPGCDSGNNKIIEQTNSIFWDENPHFSEVYECYSCYP
jgi:hypothetical protein